MLWLLAVAVAQGLIIIIFNHHFLSSGESCSQNSLLSPTLRTSTYVGKRLIKIRRQIIPTSPFPLLVILPVPGNSSLPLSNHLAWPPDPMFPLGILSCVLFQYLSNVLSLFPLNLVPALPSQTIHIPIFSYISPNPQLINQCS